MTLFCERTKLTVDSRKFFTELQRRKVYQASVIHAMPSWQRLVQIAPRVLPFFDTPNRVVHLVRMRIGSRVRPLENLS